MPNFYLDIETSGLDPKKDKIITIQFMKLDMTTAKPIGNLTILKEWESDERAIVKKFIEQSGITDGYKFSFVPVGYNLMFEHNFLIEKSRKYGFEEIDMLSRPFIDLKACGVIMNNGFFKGCGLDKLTRKPHSGIVIQEWAVKGEHEKIINYIEIETEEFVKLCMWLYKHLPGLWKRFKEINDMK